MLLSQNFDEVDDLVQFVQSSTGKIDFSVITACWLGQEHMLKGKVAPIKYIKFKCER